MLKATLALKSEILDMSSRVAKVAQQKLQAVTILELTEADMESFAKDMTAKKCDELTRLVTEAEQIYDSVKMTADSWKVDIASLYTEMPILKDFSDKIFLAVACTFAVKCILSKAAVKRLATAVAQADKALQFAKEHNLELPAWLKTKLEALQPDKQPCPDDK